MVFSYPLRSVLARNAPYQCVLEAFHDSFMDAVAEVLHSALALLQNHWIVEVRKFAFRFGVHPTTRTMVIGKAWGSHAT